MNPIKKKVYGYCRTSTEEQIESLEAQEQQIKDYCKLKNLEIISIHKELGVSGSVPPRKRPQLNYILSSLEIKKDDCTGFVVTKIDRIGRTTLDFLNLMDEVKEKNFDFYLIEPDIDRSSPIGQCMMTLISAISELERNMIRDRTKAVINNKKLKGELVGGIPFGKRLIENTNILEDDPQEQETLKLIKELRQQTKEVEMKDKTKKMKKLTYKDICNKLEELKKPNKQGSFKWFPSQMRRCLNDGDYKSGRIKK